MLPSSPLDHSQGSSDGSGDRPPRLTYCCIREMRELTLPSLNPGNMYSSVCDGALKWPVNSRSPPMDERFTRGKYPQIAWKRAAHRPSVRQKSCSVTFSMSYYASGGSPAALLMCFRNCPTSVRQDLKGSAIPLYLAAAFICTPVRRWEDGEAARASNECMPIESGPHLEP